LTFSNLNQGKSDSLSVQLAHKKIVESLAIQEIKFSACGNTIRKATKKNKGKKPKLTAGVKVTASDASRIIELQEQGYSYLRP